MPECIKCGAELEFDETVDSWADEEIVEMKNHGHCPKCGTLYKWKDLYKYLDFQDLEERW